MKERFSVHLTFGALGVLLVFVLGTVYVHDQKKEWKSYQESWRGSEMAKATTKEEKKRAAALPIELRQIALPELGRVDRCMTCHVVVEDPSYAGLAEPLSYHPDHDRHPFEKFGCTLCHQGQGRATTKEDAHGHVEHWPEPLLPLEYLNAACGKCHSEGRIEGAEDLFTGKFLFEEKGCIGCHRVGERGGNIGPALDRTVGHRDPGWLSDHFLDPRKLVPDSTMPAMAVTAEEARFLTVYVLSLSRPKLTEYLLSKRLIPTPLAGAKLFEEKRCVVCHSLGGRGAKVGPPLDEVAARRSPEWMVAHFKDPEIVSPGTVMPHFTFSDAEAWALTNFLIQFPKSPDLLPETQNDLVALGRKVFRRYGCPGCHGPEGKAGVKNRNAMGGVVPALTRVAEGYTRDELKDVIRKGRSKIDQEDPNGPTPPLFMPRWGPKISEPEIDRLVDFLMSLMPKGEETEEW